MCCEYEETQYIAHAPPIQFQSSIRYAIHRIAQFIASLNSTFNVHLQSVFIAQCIFNSCVFNLYSSLNSISNSLPIHAHSIQHSSLNSSLQFIYIQFNVQSSIQSPIHAHSNMLHRSIHAHSISMFNLQFNSIFSLCALSTQFIAQFMHIQFNIQCAIQFQFMKRRNSLCIAQCIFNSSLNSRTSNSISILNSIRNSCAFNAQFIAQLSMHLQFTAQFNVQCSISNSCTFNSLRIFNSNSLCIAQFNIHCASVRSPPIQYSPPIRYLSFSAYSIPIA